MKQKILKKTSNNKLILPIFFISAVAGYLGAGPGRIIIEGFINSRDIQKQKSSTTNKNQLVTEILNLSGLDQQSLKILFLDQIRNEFLNQNDPKLEKFKEDDYWTQITSDPSLDIENNIKLIATPIKSSISSLDLEELLKYIALKKNREVVNIETALNVEMKTINTQILTYFEQMKTIIMTSYQKELLHKK